MNIVNMICPYCKTIIRSEDETVICSMCEMPHHKDCWVENQGCTTFGCLGAIASPERCETNISEQWLDFDITFEGDIVIGNVDCHKCGNLNDVANKFCCFCGNKLIKK